MERSIPRFASRLALSPRRSVLVALSALLTICAIGYFSISYIRPVPARERLLISRVALAPWDALVEQWNASLSGIELGLRPVTQTEQSVADVQDGRSAIGIASADTVYPMYRHGSAQRNFPHSHLRGIAVVAVGTLYVLVRVDSDITGLSDLRGRQIGVSGLPATSYVAATILAAAGVKTSEVTLRFVSPARMPTLVASGELDAAFLPSSATDQWIGSDASLPLRALPLDSSVRSWLLEKYPFVRPVVLHRGQFPSPFADTMTVGSDVMVFCRDDLDDDTAHALTEALAAALPSVANQFGMARPADVEDAPATLLPLHPGAARFYRERELLH
jgi:uncharacterized protein